MHTYIYTQNTLHIYVFMDVHVCTYIHMYAVFSLMSLRSPSNEIFELKDMDILNIIFPFDF